MMKAEYSVHYIQYTILSNFVYVWNFSIVKLEKRNDMLPQLMKKPPDRYVGLQRCHTNQEVTRVFIKVLKGLTVFSPSGIGCLQASALELMSPTGESEGQQEWVKHMIWVSSQLEEM